MFAETDDRPPVLAKKYGDFNALRICWVFAADDG
jgi:hypothetical protein